MLARIAAELGKPGGTLVLLHGNADPDALASGFAIQQAFPEVTIGTPQGIDRMAKLMANALGIRTEEEIAETKHARMLILDTSGPDQLPEGLGFSKAIVVDHHARNAKWDSAALYHCDDSKNSCAEIIYEFLKESGKELSRNTALALLLGIVTDTGTFKFAKPNALATFAEIMSAHTIEMDEVLGLVGVETDVSEKISQLKGAQRLKYWKVGEAIIATSYGSAFEASVCKALLSLGADIALVGSQRDDRFRISGRATQKMVRRGVHLGKIMSGVGSETSNGGGGHPGAAGINGIGDVEAILNILVEEVTRVLKNLGSARDD